MKTLQVGKVQINATPWPVGLVVECPVCHWRGEIEAKDLDTSIPRFGPVQVITERKPGGRQEALISCPTPGCGTTIHEDRPEGNWMPVYSSGSPLSGEAFTGGDWADRSLPFEGDIQSPPARSLR